MITLEILLITKYPPCGTILSTPHTSSPEVRGLDPFQKSLLVICSNKLGSLRLVGAYCLSPFAFFFFLTPCIGFKAFLPEPPRNKGNYPSRMLCSWTRVSRALTPRCRHGDPAGPGYGPTSSRGFGRLIPPPAMFQEAPCSFISTYSSCILSRGLVIFPCEGC